MPIWVRAGFAYFGAVFAVGFLLGSVRVTFVIPRVGPMAAVLLELPLILIASWIVSRKLVARFAVPPTATAAMGAFAFAVLMLAELALAMVLAGQTPAQHFATYQQPHAMLGLAGQIAFACIPYLQKQSGVAS